MDTHVDVATETPDPRPEGPLCSEMAQIVEVNDAPTSMDVAVNVAAATTTADEPFAFTAAHFAYSDEEGDALDHITIETVPAVGRGTLRSGDPLAAVTAGATIMPDDIAGLRYHPADSAAAAQGYATFTFSVNDGTSDSSPANTVTINLVPAGQMAATGAPTVTPAADPHQRLCRGCGAERQHQRHHRSQQH